MALDNEDPNDDIAGDIRAAMATLKDEAPATAAEIETPVVEATSEPVAERDDGRDDKGRFKAKDQPTQAAAEPVSKTASVQGAEAAATGTEPVAPPAKWDPEAKAAFMAAPREVQKQLLAHADATEKANADWQPKAQTFAMIEQVIAPQREAWARSGMTEAQAIAGLVQAQQMLDQDPISGLVQIAKSYGLTRADWLAAAGIGPEGETEPAAPVQDPRYDALMQEVRSLKGTLTQAEQSKQQQAQADIQKTIDEFARDPKHLYFENVKPLMGALLKSGQAPDLSAAYQMACRADPRISALVSASESKAKAEADKAAIAAKKAAGGSVTGSPGERGKAIATAEPNNQPDDIRGDVRRTLAELRTH